MTNLTLVVSQYMHEVYNHRLRFGRPVQSVRIDRTSSYSAYEPGNVFGYIRWQRDKYGTQDWRIYVCRAAHDGCVTRLPGITPGADVLFALHGSSAVKRMLKHIDVLEKRAGDLEQISPAYWRQLQNAKSIRRPAHALSASLSPVLEV
ncbi:MAG: hypothetical protein COB36_14275 [Alphaproteobacteria bacterium]|nr:MAG: hypothetical protein COB36_14275 [Alphaproteobacteria bacterium]